MRRWLPPFVLTLLACIPVLLARGTGSAMLDDTDTKVLLAAIRERQDPLSWFTGDWPLQNHFYRPISTLFFEMDNALYGSGAAGYGWTNALLCVACILLTFWVIRELFDQPWVAGAGATLFALWHVSRLPGELTGLCVLVSWGVLVGGVLRHRLAVRHYLPAFLVLTFLAFELSGVVNLEYRMVDWLPGRTASVMTVFALIAMASYARYERLSALRDLAPEPTPLDPPATRSAMVAAEPPRAVWFWSLFALVATALALGSYEQAVMLPAALFGVALCMRLQRYRVRWGWQAPFWALLVGYLALRYQIVPREVSGYQDQQFRNGPGVWLDLSTYLVPFASGWPGFRVTMETGLLVLITPGPYQYLTLVAANVAAFVRSRPVWVMALTGWLLSFFTFLPMAWLKSFDHYHYWPMAMRSMLVMALVIVAVRETIRALSPPAIQAPARG